MIINQQTITRLGTGFKGNFTRALQSREQNAEWMKLATLVNSTTRTEEYSWLGKFPKLQKWLGDRVVKQLEAQKYSITNEKYEATIEVDRDDIEDDNIGIYAPLFEEMGIAAAEWPTDLVFAVLKSGFDTECYDGEFFFDTDHPEGDGTVSNDGGGAGDPWFLLDTSRALKPLVFQRRIAPQLDSMDDPSDPNVFLRDVFLYGVRARGAAGFGLWQMAYGSKQTLDATNFDAAVAAMMSRKNDEGQTLGIRPNLLVCGPSNRAAAKTLLEAQYLASGASNTNFRAVDLMVSTHLD